MDCFTKSLFHTMKVLLVEDEEIIAHVHQMFIERLGGEVVGIAGDSESAFRLAIQKRPDVIMMDVRLESEADGIDTVLAIQKLYPIPVIYVSGNSDDRTMERAALTEMIAFLVKPISPDELEKVIHSYFNSYVK